MPKSMETPSSIVEKSDAEQTPAATTSTKPQQQRVFACVLCQQRKVKCERKFPCARCVRSGVQCVPVSLPRQRRRRFPERDLLQRLRHYENLLRQNNIKFEPLHAPPGEDGREIDPEDDTFSEVTGAVKANRVNLWHAISRMIVDIDDEQDNNIVRDAIAKHAWDITYQTEGNSHLLFGPPKSTHLTALHPDQVQIFKLWQIYLENVNPLLKVTHTPTLQARIIDGVHDMANMNSTLEVLIFSIYCVSVLSLTEDECNNLFRSSRQDLLARYQFACQQALLNCKAFQSNDLDCLTAFYFYLVSVRPNTDPRSLSSMLAVAIHIARRIGIHDESSNSKCAALEAEMRRRLWWSLVIFDSQVCEMLDYQTATLSPTWDCRTILNVDDSELRVEMKALPAVQEKPTEALFAAARSELGDFARHNAFHLDFIDPSLNDIARAKGARQPRELSALEKTIEDKYLSFCDSENPLHFMTIWTIRAYLAKSRLLEHYSKHSTSSTQQTESQRKAAISYALIMLNCDTKLLTLPLTKSYRWLVHLDFPFIAYAHILQALRQWPADGYNEKAWDTISDNYEARLVNPQQGKSIFIVFSRGVLQAWEACEALSTQNMPMELPRIVLDVRNKLAQMRPDLARGGNVEQPNGTAPINLGQSVPAARTDYYELGTGGQYFASGPGIAGQTMVDVDMNQLWTTMDWNWIYTQNL